MKTIFLLTLLALIADGCKNQKNNTAEQTLNEFYTQYITACDEMSDDTEIKEKFLTKELITKLARMELDYDPFLDAQDCDKAWIETLAIEQTQENVYLVSLFPKHSILLSVEKDGDRYFINDIEGLSDNSLESAQPDNAEQKYLITDYAVDIFIIGEEIPYYSDKYSITKRIETRAEEGEEFEIPIYTVSEDGQNILSLEAKYDYGTEQFTEQIGSIYVLNDKFKTADNIGLHSTIEDFTTAYPDFSIWYSYINDWYVMETKKLEFVQFFLDGNDFIKEGGIEFDSDREILQLSEFKKGSRIKAIRIWG